MHNKNYDEVFINELNQWKNNEIKPSVLIHACCAPCLAYPLSELYEVANITVFFSNSNIYPLAEYQKRFLALESFVLDFNAKNNTNIKIIKDEYNPNYFLDQVKKLSLEKSPEGGLRCKFCFNMRLDNAALFCQEESFDYFVTTLTSSPHKNSELINKVGLELSDKYNVKYLPSDFKKRSGVEKGLAISKEYNIYRQNYCGCVFSLKHE